MAITTLLQTQLVDGVGSVIITSITQDPDTNLWTRQINVYGQAEQSGTPPLLFTLQLSSDTQAAVELTAPSALF